MPDIYRGQALLETEDTVEIPDVFFGEAPPLEEGPEPALETPEEEAEAPAEEPDVEEEPPPEEELPPQKTREEIMAEEAAMLEDIRREVREQAYRDAYQQATQEGFESGYQEGLRQKRGELKESIAEVERQLDAMQGQQKAFLTQFAQELKFMAIDVAEKIIFQKIEEDDLILTNLVTQAITSVKNTKWLTVELSERLIGLVEYMRSEVNKPDYHGRVEIDAVACPDDTCRVNSDEGTLVASVSVQAENLRALFRGMEADNS